MLKTGLRVITLDSGLRESSGDYNIVIDECKDSLNNDPLWKGLNNVTIFTSDLPQILPFMGPGYLDRYNRIAPLIWGAWLRARAKNPDGFAIGGLMVSGTRRGCRPQGRQLESQSLMVRQLMQAID